MSIDGREVRIDGGDGVPPVPAYAAFPDGPPRYGVVVIHELFGRQPEIDRACDRIARAGAVAVAPDLMANGRARCLFDMARATRTGETTVPVLQTRNARRWLAQEADVPESRIALLGFCLGGGFVLAAWDGFAVVSSNYGTIPAPEVMRGIPPVVACFGARDRVFSPGAKTLRTRLEVLGVPHEVHVVENAGHSFLTDAEHGVMRYLAAPMSLGGTAEAREEGWAKIFSFFDAQLSRDARR